jgi:hypothetical protein
MVFFIAAIVLSVVNAKAMPYKAVLVRCTVTWMQMGDRLLPNYCTSTTGDRTV